MRQPASRYRRNWPSVDSLSTPGELGWTLQCTAYCQLTREANKVKRLEYAQQILESGDTFHNVIFSDESSITLEQHRRTCYRKIGFCVMTFFHKKIKRHVKVIKKQMASQENNTSLFRSKLFMFKILLHVSAFITLHM